MKKILTIYALIVIVFIVAATVRPTRRIKSYNALSITVTNATTNNISFGNVSDGYDLLIANDAATLSEDLSIHITSLSNPAFVLKQSESLTITSMYFTNLWLINTSGANIAVRILIIGE